MLRVVEFKRQTEVWPLILHPYTAHTQTMTREKEKSLIPSTPVDFRPFLPNCYTELPPSSAAPNDPSLSWVPCPPPCTPWAE